jgi:AbiJ N-terminal domain 4
MIKDIFQRRYQGVLSFDRRCAEQTIGPTLVQARFIFFEDIQPKLSRDFGETFFREINQMLARELGCQSLKQLPFAAINELNICSSFLATPFQPSNSEWFGDPDHFCKTRLSMLELLFREAEKHVRRRYVVGSPVVGKPLLLDKGKLIATAAMNNPIQELNARLQANRTGLVYVNGFLHLATDKLSTERIAKPFWEIVSDPKWKIVDQEMKEAIDRLDHGAPRKIPLANSPRI